MCPIEGLTDVRGTHSTCIPITNRIKLEDAGTAHFTTISLRCYLFYEHPSRWGGHAIIHNGKDQIVDYSRSVIKEGRVRAGTGGGNGKNT